MSSPQPALNIPWFESPFFERELEASDLDPRMRDLVRSFAERGYVLIDLGGEEFDGLAEGIVAALAEEHERAGRRVTDAWRYVPQVRELATHSKVLETLRALYRRRPVPFQTLNFNRGTEQGTHSDLVHFNSLPQRYMAGVWVALEDIRPESGPLHYFPGSHRLPVYELHDIGLAASSLRNRDEQYETYVGFLRELLAESGLPKETIAPRRGQALIWAANLLHGGEPIEDPESTRLSQVTHFYFEGCRYYTPLYSDPPLGHYAWRRVIDVGSGREQPHFYNGSRVRLPLRTRAHYALGGKLTASSPGRAAVRAVRRALGRD